MSRDWDVEMYGTKQVMGSRKVRRTGIQSSAGADLPVPTNVEQQWRMVWESVEGVCASAVQRNAVCISQVTRKKRQ